MLHIVLSQSNNASIDGEITDPKGAVVQGANVVLTAKDTNESSKFVSDANGLYSFRNVLPGTYQLRVTAPGFGEYVQDGILVRVGYPIRQNIQLKLQTTVQQVEVSADASALNFENAELRNSIDPQVIEQVPLLVSGSIRSAANFASLLPGVVRGSGRFRFTIRRLPAQIRPTTRTSRLAQLTHPSCATSSWVATEPLRT